MPTKEEILKKHLDVDVDINQYPKGYPYVIEAMKDFAKQEAIAFKEWQDSNLEEKGWQQYDGHDRWINPHTREVISTEQLYNLYLQSKQI